jgi:hypothetical protein
VLKYIVVHENTSIYGTSRKIFLSEAEDAKMCPK